MKIECEGRLGEGCGGLEEVEGESEVEEKEEEEEAGRNDSEGVEAGGLEWMEEEEGAADGGEVEEEGSMRRMVK